MLTHRYREFQAHAGDWLHCTAHSHHPWPDVTRAAQLAYWEDSVRLTDGKWDHVFGSVIPEAQRHIARHLGLSRPTDIAFAPNTHELVARLYSCIDWRSPRRVVTTASEFHSFSRQTRRLEETGRLTVMRVPAEPFDTFEARFAAALAERCDLVFLSHVFFDSGFVVGGLERIARAAPPESLVVIDGYHAFLALPVDLSAVEDRVFYLAGGYKYAQSGEGACFLATPAAGAALRPLFTGWFADFGELTDGGKDHSVGYGAGGMRFFGATFDPSGLYRFNAVMRMLEDDGVDAPRIHAHVQALERRFVEGLAQLRLPALPVDALVPPDPHPRGSFVTFDLAQAAELERTLLEHHIRVDRRGSRLRFGFGIYHDAASIDRLLERLARVLG